MKRPLKVEIGFGTGDFLVETARKEPETDFIGIEIYGLGIKKLQKKIKASGIENITVQFGDAKEVLPSLPGPVEEFFINFPDPWPKKKHRKRRLIKPGLVDLLSRALAPGGRVTVATDVADYAGEALSYFEAHGSFLNLAGRMNFLNRIEGRIPTKYEKKYLLQGIRIYYLQFEKES